MKNLFRLVMVMFALTIILSSVVSAASYKRNPDDVISRGDWMGKYGSDGYFIVGDDLIEDIDKVPSYASLTFENSLGDVPGKWTWYDSETSIDELEEYIVPSALYIDDAKTIRRASCYFDADLFSVTVDVGGESKTVSLYFTDFDDGAREEYISVYDENGAELDIIDIYSFQEGIYISALISGKVTFEIINGGGPNAVISAVFFDPDPDVTAAGTEAEIDSEAPETEGEVIPEAAPETAPVDLSDTSENVSAEAPQTNDTIVLTILSGLISIITLKYTGKRKFQL